MAFAHPAPAKPVQDRLPPAIALANNPAQAFARFPLDGFRKEEGSGIYTPQHKTDPRLERMLSAWEKFEATSPADILANIDGLYDNALGMASGIRCSASELEAFILALSNRFRGEQYRGDPLAFSINAGVFISALIDQGAEDRYLVRTYDLGTVSLIGMYNHKHVVIEGNVGDRTGMGMEDGSLVIKGNALTDVGTRMCGGELTVERDAGSAGEGMTGGIVTITGNVVGHIGNRMSGGKIRIQGRCKNLDYEVRVRYGGEIFVGGVQVYPRQAPEPNREVV